MKSQLFASIVFATLLGAMGANAEPGYVSFFSGPRDDVSPATTGGLLLVGGADDLDDAMQWMVDKSGHGNFVILRASGEDGYNDWMMAKGAHSVESIQFNHRNAASDPYVLQQIRNAEAIFFAGGDQSYYVNYWKGTPLAALVNQRAAQGVPIGGTSAGLAILGQFVYAAQFESAQSVDTLLNPFDHNVTMDKDFLSFPILQNIVTDSHFGARNRMGRLLTFLARMANDHWSETPRGLGVDERTAVAIEPNGLAHLYGFGHAYFLTTTTAPERCRINEPLTYRKIGVFRMGPGSTFDFNKWRGQSGDTYELSVSDGRLTSTGPDIY